MKVQRMEIYWTFFANSGTLEAINSKGKNVKSIIAYDFVYFWGCQITDQIIIDTIRILG